MAPFERRSADDELRGRLGLVLLDVGDGVERAVELEAGNAGRHPAGEGVESRFQLYADGAGFPRFARELLGMGFGLVCLAGSPCIWEGVPEGWLFGIAAYIPVDLSVLAPTRLALMWPTSGAGSCGSTHWRHSL